MTLHDILHEASARSASDVHLKVETQPQIRINGNLEPISISQPKISREKMQTMVESILDSTQLSSLRNQKEIDVGYGVSGLGRFRINIFHQRGSLGMVIRSISHIVPSINELCLPPMVGRIADADRGLVLVCGSPGSGKSTTLAAMIDLINRTRNKHIITLEDPIEYLIHDQKSLISQREIGIDTNSYARALRSALRQDPDVIMIGEIRDRATLEVALAAAKTGKLIFSTLCAMDAQESLQRIFAMYNKEQQSDIRSQVASALRSIISQKLFREKKMKRKSYLLAEILVNNDQVRSMILDPSKTDQVKHFIDEGRSGRYGQSFDQSLWGLVSQGVMELEDALSLAENPTLFQKRMKPLGIQSSHSSEEDLSYPQGWLLQRQQ